MVVRINFPFKRRYELLPEQQAKVTVNKKIFAIDADVATVSCYAPDMITDITMYM